MAYLSDKLKLLVVALRLFVPYGFKLLFRSFLAVQHRWTYDALPSADAQNVVVVGGSFAGWELATRLSQTLPTGYRVVLVERNSHFNWSWAFPRFAVIPRHEEKVFIPYRDAPRGAPAGIWRHVRGAVVRVTEGEVHLDSGEAIPYAFLAIATGAAQPVPARVRSTDAAEGCVELRAVQRDIADAARIAVVGGGAVGVEIAADVKSFFPHKTVTLFHSRDQLLPAYQKRLHAHVTEAFAELGIRVVYGERPQILPGAKSLRTSAGVEEFDLITSRPDAISKETKHILVQPTLQIQDPSNALGHIFALGDVAATGGPKMARAAQFQAEVVATNILDLVAKRRPRRLYKSPDACGGRHKGRHVVYGQEDDGSDLMIPGKGGREDLDIKRAWRWMGVKYKA
ncbi:putative amid-like NADH oxidoreductase [Mycena latifolia]|nr:putative amid-like NADH oxidoreductase [Mycena latifolia]